MSGAPPGWVTAHGAGPGGRAAMPGAAGTARTGAGDREGCA